MTSVSNTSLESDGHTHPRGRSAENATQLIAVVALVAIAYGCVSIVFGHRTPVPDEIRPLLLTQVPLAQQMAGIRADIVQTPVFNLVARGWFAVVGSSDLAAKTLVASVNLLALGLFTYLAWRVTRFWWLASLLATLTYLRVGSSVTLIRMYFLTLLLVIAAMVAWDRWVRTGSRATAALWCACMVAAVYTHASAGLLLPAFVVGTWPILERRRAAIFLSTAVAVSIVPWVLYVMPEVGARGLGANIESLARLTPLRATARIPFEFISGEWPGGASQPLTINEWAARLPLRWGALVLHVALLAALAGSWMRIGAGGVDRHIRWFIPTALLAPPGILLTLSLVGSPVVHTRYVLVCLPAYWLGLAWLGAQTGRWGRTLLLVLTIWVAVSAALTWRVHLPTPPIRLATQHVASQWSERDVLVSAGHYPYGYQGYWEWHWRLGHEGRLVTLDPEPFIRPWLRDILPHQPLAASIFDGVDRAWVIVALKNRETAVRDSLDAYGFASVPSGIDWPLLLKFERVRQ